MLGEKLLAESGRIEQLSRGILWFSRPGEEPTSALSVKNYGSGCEIRTHGRGISPTTV